MTDMEAPGRVDELRREIVAVGRRLYERGLVAGSEGNISTRLSGGRILATPSGASKGFLSPEDLVVTDLAGRSLDGGRASSELHMHLKVYALRDDVAAVVHAHPPTATGFAIAGRALDECVVPEVIATLGQVPIVPYGTPSTEELPDRMPPWVASHDALLLANHGAVTYAPSLAQAIDATRNIYSGAASSKGLVIEIAALMQPPHHHVDNGLVILLALGLIRQHVVGFGDFLEALFSRGVARVLIRVVVSRQLPVCLLDLLRGGILGDTEDLVVVLLEPLALRCHGGQSRTFTMAARSRWPAT